MREMNLEFELVVHGFDKSLRSEDYLAISPAGRVPALVHDGHALVETGAITEYLCETFPTPLFRAPGDPERRDWLQWLHFSETLGQMLANLTQQHIVIREDADRSPLLMSLERRRVEKILAFLDGHLARQDFMLESGFSAIDTNMGYGIDVARRFAPLDKVPNVAAYHERIAARPAFQASLPPENARRIYRQRFYELPEILD